MTEDDDLDRDIRDLLHHPQPLESAQERAIAFAQRRLDRDMLEAARLRRGATRRRIGRFVIATALLLLAAAAVATATDSHFLRDVLGKETPIADRVQSVRDAPAVTPTIDRFGDPADAEVDDGTWSQLKMVARTADPDAPLRGRSSARVLLSYTDKASQVTIAAAPTTQRSVCLVAVGSSGSGFCSSYFSLNKPVASLVQRDASGWSVLGLAADEVESIRIMLDNGRRTALIRNNAFYWKSTSSSEVPRSLEAILSSGQHTTVKLTAPVAARPDRPIK